MTEQELIEHLADAEHASWARWMAYLFSKCNAGEHLPNEYPEMTVPSALVSRWHTQAVTPYADLSEQEKQSDRDEVAHILPFIQRYAAEQANDVAQHFLDMPALPKDSEHPEHPEHPAHPHHHRHLKRAFVETLGRRAGALVGSSPQPHRDQIEDELFNLCRTVVHDLFGLLDEEWQRQLGTSFYDALREAAKQHDR